MRYLILDKRQRVQTSNEKGIATADLRIMEEIEKMNTTADLAYWDQLEFEFIDGETKIKANDVSLEKYSHIILRGHDLHSPIQYEFKRYIIEYAEQYNNNNPEQKLLVQNAEAIKALPYYNKISMAIFCSRNSIPYFNTYYATDGNYTKERDILNNYPLIIKEYAGINRLQTIDGVEKIKKNVFKLNSEQDLEQEFLAEQDHSRFFLQDFSTDASDMRIFVKNGSVIGGWKRKATDGFMTVKGGEYEMYNTPSEDIQEIAEKVARTLKANFMAVDFMHMDGKPLLQEISFHPGFKAYETKIEGEPVNIAKEIATAF